MEFINMRVLSNPHSIPVAQAAISNIAELCGISRKDISKLEIALEEAMSNIITFGFPDKKDSYFNVSVDISEMDFKIIIHDQGKPYDFENVDDDVSSSAGIKLMRGLTDGLVFKNLGEKGREQHLIKHLTALPEYTRRPPEEEVCDLENLEFDIHPLRKSEAIEVSQCVCDEFGYTYPSELVYYPEQYYDACQKNDYFSLVATAPNGEIAGHLALMFSPHFPGIAEMGIGVVKKKFRNYSLMSRLTNEIIKIAENDFKLNALTAQPVVYHPYTQKICNKTSFTACGFVLHYVNYNMANTFDDVGDGVNVAVAFRIFNNKLNDIYVPEEAKEMVSTIISLSGLERKLLDGMIPAEGSLSEVITDINQRLKIGKVFIEHAGSDIHSALKTSLLATKREKCAVVELFINLSDACAPFAYEAAKDFDYFCTGLLPCSQNGDYLTMQCLLGGIVDYDTLRTIEPFTTLLQHIRGLDPNEG